MRTARWLALPLAALLAGAALAPAAQADSPVRIYIGLGDVLFDAGRPYYRYDHSPVYVVYDDYRRPRYYRYAPVRYYAPPVRHYAPPRYYTPVAYRPVYRDYRWDRYDRHDHDDHDRGKGHGRGHDHH